MSRRGWVAAVGILAVWGGGCGDDPAPSDASLVCTTDEQCADAVFCNGAERCEPSAELASPLGCVAGELPCLEGQRCDEAGDACAALCEVTTDADGDGVAAVDCGGDDCDDANPDRYPGNTEICDASGIDEDCDSTTLGGRDIDGDGYVDAACCNGDTCGTDCADRMATVNPGAAEVCDLVDQDCDGDVDEGVQSAGYEDRDGDRHGDPDRAIMACAFDGDVAPGMLDCDDTDGRRHGQMLELCDSEDNDCDGAVDEARFSVSWYADADGDGFGDPGGEVRSSCEPIDGFSTLPFDCDDGDAARSPITPEACNALDDDCDGRADFQLEAGDTEDDDGDGVADARCPGGGMDCDDRDPFAKPGAPELCDGVDNDCDGAVDEGATEQLWLVDDDGDGFGDDAAERRASCERVPGLVLEGGDCDDGDPEVRPAARERCNGLDDDCDGLVDEDAGFVATYADDDGDGFGAGMPLAQCAVAGLRALVPGDCDDGSPATRPGAAELCDQVDNDCDGSVDEAAASATWYPDADGDGFGDPSGTTVDACEPQLGYSVLGSDCDDTSALAFPLAPELCDAVDQDCDGMIDEDATEQLQYLDDDGDGFGGGTGISSCDPLAGHALRPEDCDDGDPAVRPGATEDCNGVDDDCDGAVDEAPAGTIGCAVDSTNATPVCDAGVCGYGSCLTGFDDCDGTSTNGCETTLASDPLHCGACGASCGLADTCTGGACDLASVDDMAVTELGGCALRNAQVYCWGNDAFGIVGDGPLYSGIFARPMRPVVGLSDAVQIDGSRRHVCAVRATGETVCWGRGLDGELGDGNPADRDQPVTVAGGHVFVEIFGGAGTSTCGLTAAGEVYCWGAMMGIWGLATTPTPLLDTDDLPITDALDVAVGALHVCLLRSDRRVYCAGSAETGNGLLGYPATLNNPRFGPPVVGLDDVQEVAAGNRHACARRTDGSVWCWGRNALGQLGDGGTTNRVEALPVSGLSDARSLELGFDLSCAARTDDTLVCWGTNVRESMGDPTFTDTYVAAPRAIPGLTNVRFVSARMAGVGNEEGPTCVVEGNATVYCWGANDVRERGAGTSPGSGIAQVIGFP